MRITRRLLDSRASAALVLLAGLSTLAAMTASCSSSDGDGRPVKTAAVTLGRMQRPTARPPRTSSTPGSRTLPSSTPRRCPSSARRRRARSPSRTTVPSDSSPRARRATAPSSPTAPSRAGARTTPGSSETPTITTMDSPVARARPRPVEDHGARPHVRRRQRRGRLVLGTWPVPPERRVGRHRGGKPRAPAAPRAGEQGRCRSGCRVCRPPRQARRLLGIELQAPNRRGSPLQRARTSCRAPSRSPPARKTSRSGSQTSPSTRTASC